MKNMALALLCLLCLCFPTIADSQYFEGTFQGLETGDYIHMIVADEKGVERSFWLTHDPSLVPFIEHPEQYLGDRVRVYWQRVVKEIPEADGPIELEEATSIERL